MRKELEAIDSELLRTKKEVDRLVKNRASLYEIMSDMVILVGENYAIEDMNHSAITSFGDLRGKKCHLVLRGNSIPCEDICPIRLAHSGQRPEDFIEKKIGEMYVEISYVPFHGYHEDKLVMLIMRNITKRKQHEMEIAEFNNNIEGVLHQKIGDLKESEKIRSQLIQEVNILKKELERLQRSDDMVGESKRIRELREIIYQVADSNATILITGESGTGKELIADLVVKHNTSRRNKPYLKFNCAAVSESLLESDLFGYEKGSFTGAMTSRKGKFEIADNGTIFLDEIGDISPKMQASLLRVLQNGEIIRVGGTTPIQVDVRIIAATNVDLVVAVETGAFRKDLYYRLNVINLHQPPLRERKEDIVLLATFFIKKYRVAFKKDIDFLPDRIIDRLLLHTWPGNIRELENVIQRAVLLTKGNVISEKELFFDQGSESSRKTTATAAMPIDDKMYSRPLKDSLADVERHILSNALKVYNDKVHIVSQKLKVGKTALYGKMKKYGILCKGGDK